MIFLLFRTVLTCWFQALGVEAHQCYDKDHNKHSPPHSLRELAAAARQEAASLSRVPESASLQTYAQYRAPLLGTDDNLFPYLQQLCGQRTTRTLRSSS